MLKTKTQKKYINMNWKRYLKEFLSTFEIINKKNNTAIYGYVYRGRKFLVGYEEYLFICKSLWFSFS